MTDWWFWPLLALVAIAAFVAPTLRLAVMLGWL